MNFISKFVRRGLLFCVLIAFICGSVHSANYNFTKSDSVTFPVTGGLQDYKIYDVNGDGYDELIALFGASYYVYSFQTGEIIYSDSAAFNASAIGDIDDDGANELVLLNKSGISSHLYVQELSLADDPQLAFEYQGHKPFYSADPVHGVTLQVGDFDCNGKIEVFEGSVVEYFISYDPLHNEEEWFDAGEAIFVDALTGDIINDIYGSNILSIGRSVVADLEGDCYKQIIGWGEYYYYKSQWVYGPPDGLVVTSVTRYDMALANSSSVYALTASSVKPMTAVAGNLSAADPGDEVVFFKYENTEGIYKLQLLNRVEQRNVIKWSEEVTSAQNCLIALSSLPGTFCASDGSGQFTLYNGSDGSAIGAVNGLLITSNTTDGHFADFPDDPIQAVQLSSNKAYLYTLESVTGVEEVDHGIVPNDFVLYQNQPNPFNPSTVIPFALSSRASVTLSVYNLLGQKVVDLVDEEMPVGNYQVDWNGTDEAGKPVSSGVYFYLLRCGDHSLSKKMILLK